MFPIDSARRTAASAKRLAPPRSPFLVTGAA
jgi:hypothetical protein